MYGDDKIRIMQKNEKRAREEEASNMHKKWMKRKNQMRNKKKNILVEDKCKRVFNFGIPSLSFAFQTFSIRVQEVSSSSSRERMLDGGGMLKSLKWVQLEKSLSK